MSMSSLRVNYILNEILDRGGYVPDVDTECMIIKTHDFEDIVEEDYDDDYISIPLVHCRLAKGMMFFMDFSNTMRFHFINNNIIGGDSADIDIDVHRVQFTDSYVAGKFYDQIDNGSSQTILQTGVEKIKFNSFNHVNVYSLFAIDFPLDASGNIACDYITLSDLPDYENSFAENVQDSKIYTLDDLIPTSDPRFFFFSPFTHEIQTFEDVADFLLHRKYKDIDPYIQRGTDFDDQPAGTWYHDRPALTTKDFGYATQKNHRDRDDEQYFLSVHYHDSTFEKQCKLHSFHFNQFRSKESMCGFAYRQ